MRRVIYGDFADSIDSKVVAASGPASRHVVSSACGAALCGTIYMDEASQWTGLAELEGRTPGVLDGSFAERQLVDQRIQFVAIVVRRTTYEDLGGFRPALPHCLDWDMWKRIALTKA